jgi:hypothetical protein
MLDLVGSAKTASNVLRCLLFMLAIYDSAGKLQAFYDSKTKSIETTYLRS